MLLWRGRNDVSCYNSCGLLSAAFLYVFNVQVSELDKFAGGMAAKKKACLEQIEKDRTELAHLDKQIGNEARK